MSEKILKNIQIWVWIITIFLLFCVLNILDFIFVPIVASFFLLILFRWVYMSVEKYFQKRYLSIFVTVFIFLAFISIIWVVLFTQAKWFFENTSNFSKWFDKFFDLASLLLEYSWVEISNDYITFDYIESLFWKLDLSLIWKNIYKSVSWFFSLFWTIIVLLLFIFLERKDFKQKARILFDVKWFKITQKIFSKIWTDLNTYFSTKFFLALLNATVATIIMSLFKLDFAFTFGLLVFFMDFIPIIWVIIALWLPFLYSLVTFDSFWASVSMIICLYIPQIVTWNFIEPKIMWEKLNLSTVVIVISLLFWSSFWWVIWAFLAIPIMATLNIILSKIESTKFISVLLSKNWK